MAEVTHTVYLDNPRIRDQIDCFINWRSVSYVAIESFRAETALRKYPLWNMLIKRDIAFVWTKVADLDLFENLGRDDFRPHCKVENVSDGLLVEMLMLKTSDDEIVHLK